MRYIDLTGPVENGMWEYGAPYPPVSIEQVSSIEDDRAFADYRVNAHRISFSSSSATYVQTAAEMIPGKPTIDEIPLSRLMLEAAVLRIPKGPRGVITREELAGASGHIRARDAVIVATGWEKSWNRENFVSDSPHFTPESMNWLLERDISLLAGDMTIYDDYHNPTGLIRELFARDVLVVAPLVNLEEISVPRVRFYALPLKVKGVSGCPCRAVAVEE